MTTQLLRRAVVLAALAFSTFIALPANSFAVPVGQTCPSSFGGPPVQFQSAVSSGASFVIPSDGVLTSWTTDRTNYLGTGVIAVAIGSKTGSSWSILATSPYEYIVGGANTFGLRMPVKAGQTLGTLAFTGTTATVCTGGYDPSADHLDYANSFQPNGNFVPTGTIDGARANVAATLEADIDQDGFGDETQDKCPQSAAWQNSCPELKLAQQLSATRNEIKTVVSASVDTSVTATATVTIAGKKKTIRSKATAVTAGKFKTIKLKLPASVKNALKKKSLRATVSATGRGLANTATATSKITLKKR